MVCGRADVLTPEKTSQYGEEVEVELTSTSDGDRCLCFRNAKLSEILAFCRLRPQKCLVGEKLLPARKSVNKGQQAGEYSLGKGVRVQRCQYARVKNVHLELQKRFNVSQKIGFLAGDAGPKPIMGVLVDVGPHEADRYQLLCDVDTRMC